MPYQAYIVLSNGRHKVADIDEFLNKSHDGPEHQETATLRSPTIAIYWNYYVGVNLVHPISFSPYAHTYLWGVIVAFNRITILILVLLCFRLTNTYIEVLRPPGQVFNGILLGFHSRWNPEN